MANIKSIGGNPIVPASVEDGAVTTAKLADGVVTDEKLVQTGGVLERVTRIKNALTQTNLLPTVGHDDAVVKGVSAIYSDGHLTVSGTATGEGGRTTHVILPFNLPAGTYTFWREYDKTNIGVVLQTASSSTVLALAQNNNAPTFTLDAETSVFVGINLVSGRTYDSTIGVQLESGSTATSFVTPSTLVAIDWYGRELTEAYAATSENYYENSVHPMASNGGLTDADNAEINRIYLLIDVSSVANLPINESGTLVTLARHQTATVQIYCDDSCKLYYRCNWGNLGWREWKRLVSLQEVSEMIPEGLAPSVMSAFTNITCCGDSLTYSQVYTGASTSRQAYVTYPAALERLTGATVTQYAVAGYTAVQWWNAYGGNIATDTNQLAIIFLGTNGGLTDTLDTDAPASADSSTWDTSTNTGAYARIVNDFIEIGARVLLLRCYATSGASGVSDLAITNAVIDEIGERFSCAVVDAPHLTSDKYHYYPDGSGINSVHYNDLGYSAFANSLIGKVAMLSDDSMQLLIPA